MGLERRLSRRDFLKGSVALLATEVLKESFYGARALIEAREIHYPLDCIPLKGLEESWHVVQLTDLHSGSVGVDRVDPEVSNQVADNVVAVLDRVGAREERTVLAFTGDGVNGDERGYSYLSEFRQCMGAFDRVPAQWRFAVQGNHDVHYEEIADVRKEYLRLGYEVLGWEEGDRLLVQSNELPFQVVGTPDFTTNPYWYSNHHKPDFSILDYSKPTLWMTHNASPFDLNNWGPLLNEEGLDTIILAGHTHGGQISGSEDSWVQKLGESYSLGQIEYDSQFISGMYEIGEHVRLNVCNGIGSAQTRIRTADRQVGIMELTPAG